MKAWVRGLQAAWKAPRCKARRKHGRGLCHCPAMKERHVCRIHGGKGGRKAGPTIWDGIIPIIAQLHRRRRTRLRVQRWRRKRRAKVKSSKRKAQPHAPRPQDVIPEPDRQSRECAKVRCQDAGRASLSGAGGSRFAPLPHARREGKRRPAQARQHRGTGSGRRGFAGANLSPDGQAEGWT